MEERIYQHGLKTLNNQFNSWCKIVRVVHSVRLFLLILIEFNLVKLLISLRLFNNSLHSLT